MKNQYRSLLTSLAALGASLVAAPAFAQDVTENFCDPQALNDAADPADAMRKIQLNGNAMRDPSKGLWLTQSTNAFSVGTAFYTKELVFKKMGENDRSLYNYFRFQMGPKANGIFGLTSIVHGFDTKQFALGSNGEGLGFGGIPKSVVFEFDNHDDPSPYNPHLSLMLDGNVLPHEADATNLDMLLGVASFVNQAIDVWIEYDHYKLGYTVRMAKPDPATGKANRGGAGAVTWEVPADGTDPAQLDLGSVTLQGFLGFTSSTGDLALANDHWIERWAFSTVGIPCGCDGEDACPTGMQCDPTTMLCMGCLSDTDCPNDPLKPRCDTQAVDTSTDPATLGVCVPCVEDANCQHISDPTRPYCLAKSAPDVNECVECILDEHCPGDAPVCDLTTHMCASCITDADCPSRTLPRCDTAADPVATCDKCISDANCTRFADTPICGGVDTGNAGTCVECNVDADCKDPTKPACAAAENVCYQCITDDHCTDPEKPVCDVAIHECSAARFVAGGGCGCSLPGDDGKGTLAALGAALAAIALGVSRRRRRR